KSKGNQFTLRDLVAKGVDPLSLRFLLLTTHYRKMLNFTFDSLKQAEASIQRIKDFLYEIRFCKLSPGNNPQIKTLLLQTEEKFFSSLSDDLNISAALSSLFQMIRKVNTVLNEGDLFSEDQETVLEVVNKINRILAVLPPEEEAELPPEILNKIELRQKARAEKNFAEADRIRNELLEQGILLEDTKEGVRWKIVRPGMKK
ncbi:MAG: DALR domain-containing protein, partial [Acidobacteriota bacterium]